MVIKVVENFLKWGNVSKCIKYPIPRFFNYDVLTTPSLTLSVEALGWTKLSRG